MDDITPLQQLDEDVLASDVHLFQPRPAYRMHSIAGGPRARSSATINYYLKDVPRGGVSIAIHNESGELVHTIRAGSRPGINRATWNLMHYPARQAKLRTKPPGNPHVVEEKRFHLQWEREGWYPILSWGTLGGFRGFLASPGTYTITLKVGDQEYKQILEVKKDPRSAGSLEDIRAQEQMQIALREDLNTASDIISQIEWLRKQCYDLMDILEQGGKDSRMIKEVNAFDEKLRAVEDELFQPIIAEGDSKSFRYPHKLYSKLSVLAGDVGELVDFAPNRQQREVHALLKERLAEQKGRFEELLMTDLPVFNRMLQEKNLSGLVLPIIKDEIPQPTRRR